MCQWDTTSLLSAASGWAGIETLCTGNWTSFRNWWVLLWKIGVFLLIGASGKRETKKHKERCSTDGDVLLEFWKTGFSWLMGAGESRDLSLEGWCVYVWVGLIWTSEGQNQNLCGLQHLGFATEEKPVPFFFFFKLLNSLILTTWTWF